jgi:hypothetical protein
MSAGNAFHPFEPKKSGWKSCWFGAVALLVAVLVPSLTAFGAPSCPGTWTIDQLQSRYEIVSAEKFRGGLTSREEAEGTVGLEVAILADRFRLGEVVIDRPAYKLQCYPVATTEGEVDPYRWSNFYGFHTARRFIEVLAVYESESSENARYRFEVIGPDELWRMFDGWLFSLKKKPGCPSRIPTQPWTNHNDAVHGPRGSP